MTDQERQKLNQAQQLRFQKYERLLRRIRQRIFDYYDTSDHKGLQGSRIIAKCQAILSPKWRAERAAAQDRKLQQTPSAFEPGCCG